MAFAARVTVSNGPGNNGQGVLLARNDSSTESRAVRVRNTDGANGVELLGLDPVTNARQTYGNGYTWAAGKEDTFALGPGETVYAASAVGVSVVCHVFVVRSVDVGG